MREEEQVPLAHDHKSIADPGAVLARLQNSGFRRRFKLGARERGYLVDNGMATIMEHGRKFIVERLAPAHPPNDGRQTPMRNHPVFIAQHATATCCRGCLEKWYGIGKGRPLSEEEIDQILNLIGLWLSRQENGAADAPTFPA